VIELAWFLVIDKAVRELRDNVRVL